MTGVGSVLPCVAPVHVQPERCARYNQQATFAVPCLRLA